MPVGSSPLARGLHALEPMNVYHIGIIPARAGFTILVRNSVTRPRDHPRSRGVYRVFESDSVTTAGSSPLARGLQSL